MPGRLLIAVGALFIAAHAYADEWTDGNAAFARGDYAAALGFFEAARDSGVSGPAVHYNIAVCQYELERYEDAGETFALIGSEYPRMAGLAEYNLGLVARRMGDTVAATEHFLKAYRLSQDNETIRVLASNQLADIDPGPEQVSSWSGAVGVRAGHDDNIALRDTAGIPLGVTTESPMLDIFASAVGSFPDRLPGWQFDGSIYSVRYFDAGDFDQNDISAGAVYEWRTGRWRVAAGPRVGTGWLGGDPFDRRIGLGVEAYGPLGVNGSASLAYSFDDISEGDEIFDGIRGDRHRIVARYRWKSTGGRRLLVRLRHEENDRRDPGVSPSRSELSVDYRYVPETGWGFEAGAAYQRSRFGDIAEPRTEKLLSVKSALTRYIAWDWMLLVEYRYSDNDSSDPTFSYDRNLLTIGGMRTF